MQVIHSSADAPSLPTLGNGWTEVNGQIMVQDFIRSFQTASALLVGSRHTKTLVRLVNGSVYVAQSHKGEGWRFSAWELMDFLSTLELMAGTKVSEKIDNLLQRGEYAWLTREQVINKMGWHDG